MSTIFFAWELGENLGHLSTTLPLALEFMRRGHRPVFAVRNTATAEKLLGPHGIAYVQAPAMLGKPPMRTGLPRNYSEILLQCGYHDPLVLAGLMSAWAKLFDLIAPDLALFDHAPTALLASRAKPVRRAVLGTGFTLPPRTIPFPDMLSGTSDHAARLRAGEELTLRNINMALTRLNQPTLGALPEIFSADAEFLNTFAEMDHYRQRENAKYLGPLHANNLGTEARWPAGERKRVFAYLRPGNRNFEFMIGQLRACGHEVLLYTPGIEPHMKTRFIGPHLRFSDEPVDLPKLAGHCDLIITYAGFHTVSASLLAGLPMLLLPQHTEQEMVAKRACELGAAISIDSSPGDVDLRPHMKALLEQPRYRDAALAFAEKYGNFNLDELAHSIVEQLEGLM